MGTFLGEGKDLITCRQIKENWIFVAWRRDGIGACREIFEKQIQDGLEGFSEKMENYSRTKDR